VHSVKRSHYWNFKNCMNCKATWSIYMSKHKVIWRTRLSFNLTWRKYVLYCPCSYVDIECAPQIEEYLASNYIRCSYLLAYLMLFKTLLSKTVFKTPEPVSRCLTQLFILVRRVQNMIQEVVDVSTISRNGEEIARISIQRPLWVAKRSLFACTLSC